MHDELEALGGFTLPSPIYILGVVAFGIAGLIAYGGGKRNGRPRERWLGVALMFYPYAIGGTALLYAIGVGLCIAAWAARRAT